jgi:hypothetical protein
VADYLESFAWIFGSLSVLGGWIWLTCALFSRAFEGRDEGWPYLRRWLAAWASALIGVSALLALIV